MRIRRVVSFLLILPAVAGAQSGHRSFPASSGASVSAVLDRLYASSRQYASVFRRITCEEHTHSEQNSAPGLFGPRIVHWKMDTVADFRVVRDAKGVAGFKDDRTWKLRDGKPVPPGTKFVPPYLLNDAFGPALLSYLAPAHRECLRYTVRATQIEFATVAGRGGKGVCADIPPDAHGQIAYDPITGTISHLERTVPLKASLPGGFSPFASVDYQAQGFEGSLYMIPYKITATKTMNGLNYSYEGMYTGCRLFKADVVIRDAQGNVIENAKHGPGE